MIDIRRPLAKGNDMKNKKLVLVIDDDPGVQDLTRDILELYGHSVLTVGNREEALSIFNKRGKEISVVLLDVVKSETAAFDVFQRIQEINPAVNVIITSVGRHYGDTLDMFGHGSTSFLNKPFRMTELLRMVEGSQNTQ
jgi:DNA-binding NtrC family response regulator